uniref:WD repeat domain 75 n=1 Tax=Laticauda laticaudata TaxID=8630 RepID=A0A8C5SWN7_LATLA
SKLFAFYALASSENSAFIIISQHEKSDKFQLMTVKLPKTPDQEVEANDLEMVLDGVSQSPKCTAFGRDECFNQPFHLYSLSPKGRLHSKWTQRWQNSSLVRQIVIIHSNLKVSAVIQGLIKGSDVKTGLIVDPRTKALVLNGKPGHLQFYSLQNDKLLYNLDVVQQEYIHQSGLDQIELVKAVFDSKGNWMATVEQRQGNDCELQMQLKLWAYNEQTQSFTLNTRINTPHEDCITAMCFRGTENSENVSPTLVTTSSDGHFKVWMLLVDKDSENESITWTCDFVGSYHNYQATNCCFCEDGSLLAVSFDKTITVWDSETWDLKCTFCHPPGTIMSLCFGRLICSKYLLGTTSSGFLCCWNLLNCSLEWSAQLHVNILQPDHLSENIAAFSQHSEYSDVFVFRPSEPRPLCIQRNVCKGKVQWAIFVPRDVPEYIASEKYQWLSQSQFYFLTETHELMTFSTKTPEERLTPSSRQLAVEESISMTPFYLLLGKHRQQMKEGMDTGKAPVQNLLGQESPAVKELLHTPAHVLPSASFLCPLFIHSLLSFCPKSQEIANPTLSISTLTRLQIS